MPVPELLSRIVSLPAALRSSDAGLIVILALFTWWGARRGALRQMLSLSLILGGLFGASQLAPRLLPTVHKLTSLGPDEALAAAWGAALFLALVAGSLVLRFLTLRMPSREQGAASRWLGAGLGLAKGLVLSVVVGYALLASSGDAPAPALSRPDATSQRPAPTAGLLLRLRGSVSAQALAQGATLLQRWFGVPPYIRAQIEAVNEQLEAAADRRPSGR